MPYLNETPRSDEALFSMKPSTTTEAREDGEELGRGTSHGPSQLHAEARDPDRVFAPLDLAAGFDILDEALGPSADLDKCRLLRAEEPPGAESGSRDLRRSHAVCDAHELRGILGTLEHAEDRGELLGLQGDVGVQKHDVNVLRLQEAAVQRVGLADSGLMDDPHLLPERPEGGSDRGDVGAGFDDQDDLAALESCDRDHLRDPLRILVRFHRDHDRSEEHTSEL